MITAVEIFLAMLLQVAGALGSVLLIPLAFAQVWDSMRWAQKLQGKSWWQ